MLLRNYAHPKPLARTLRSGMRASAAATFNGCTKPKTIRWANRSRQRNRVPFPPETQEFPTGPPSFKLELKTALARYDLSGLVKRWEP